MLLIQQILTRGFLIGSINIYFLDFALRGHFDRIMPRYWFDFGEQEPGFWIEDRDRVIRPSKCLDCLQGFKKIDDDKFGFLCSILPQDVRTSMTINALQVGNDLLAQEPFIGIGMLKACPSFPYPRNHADGSSCL